MTYLTRMTALEAKATAGPLECVTGYGEVGIRRVGANEWVSWCDTADCEPNGHGMPEDDELFYVALRNSWPKLRRLIEAATDAYEARDPISGIEALNRIKTALADLEAE